MDDVNDTRPTPIANERATRGATDVNGVAIAVQAVGGLAPLFSQRVALPNAPDGSWLTPAISLLRICVSGV